MATWMLSTVNDNSTKEVVHWVKDGCSIFLNITYRRISFLTNNDTLPAIDLGNPDVYSVFADDTYDWQDDPDDDELDFVVSQSWDWNDLTDPAAQAAVRKLWADAEAASIGDPSDRDNEWDAMEAAGWENEETSVFLYGPLKIEQITPAMDLYDDGNDLDMTDPDDILEAQRRAAEDAAIAAEDLAYANAYASDVGNQ